VQPVDAPELGDLFSRVGRERQLSVECMEADALEQIAEREILQLRQRLQHLHEPLLHARTGLHPLDRQPRARSLGKRAFGYYGNNVPKLPPLLQSPTSEERTCRPSSDSSG